MLVPSLVEGNEGKSRGIYLFYRAGSQSRDIHGYSDMKRMFTCFTRLRRKSVASFFTQRILARPPVPKQVQAFTSLPSGGF